MSKQNVVEIVAGSKVDFDIYLVTEEGTPFDLTGITAGELKFVNGAGTQTIIDLTLPGAKDGKLSVVIPSDDTVGADKKWASADLVLTDASDETLIVPLNNLFEIIEPNT